MYSVEKKIIQKALKDSYATYSFDSNVVEEKNAFDIVTSLDKNIEKYLIDVIKEEFPNDNILSEEFNPKADIIKRTWTVDPIDGTFNMAHGNVLFGIQASLIENNEIVLGVIYIPFLEEMYSAIKNEGVYLNDKKIEKFSTTENNKAIISVGDLSHSNDEIYRKEVSFINTLGKKVAKIRMFGAASIDFSFVAKNRTDGTVIITKNIWDIAPGIIICKEAGMIVTNEKNEQYHFGDEGVFVSNNKNLHKVLIDSYSASSDVNEHCI